MVIISLIVGGVIGGKSLIHSAKIHSAIQEEEAFRLAINIYVTQYDALPGDHREANAYFGNSVCPNSGAFFNCDGNGDGLTEVNWLESSQVALHLSLAELIQGSYETGGRFGTNNIAPTSPFDGLITFAADLVAGERVNSIYMGKPDSPLRITALSPLISTRDAVSIDKRMDDGKPLTGNVRVLDTADCVDTGEYLVSSEAQNACTLRFIYGR